MPVNLPEPTPAKLPSLRTMFKLRSRLLHSWRPVFLGEVADFDLLLELTAQVLPKSVDRAVLVESLRNFAGGVMTSSVLEELAHRVAGNVHRLKRGKPLRAWRSQRFREWVPVQVVAVTRMPRRGSGERGAELTLKVLAGTSCPTTLRRWRSWRWLFHFSGRLGFARRRGDTVGPLSYAVPEQLTTLRLAVLMEPTLSAHGPGFHYVEVPAQLLDWNRAQLRRRARTEAGFSCREGYPASVPCHRCWRGYSSCPAGTHRLDYEFAACAECGEPSAPFDKDLGDAQCVACFQRNVFRKG